MMRRETQRKEENTSKGSANDEQINRDKTDSFSDKHGDVLQTREVAVNCSEKHFADISW